MTLLKAKKSETLMDLLVVNGLMRDQIKKLTEHDSALMDKELLLIVQKLVYLDSKMADMLSALSKEKTE
ncbi:hypothetical protein [Bacillus sp. AFS055030]|uniref:hypothetical protein n=1 Tax=Bacillus sp. AFS055030 TaxID=2033507 RepID=UPI000BFD4D17|nr:hypothetical protein [Bacillus sp. AFS055030]PGL67847.1 hypothetical protein CN925_17940 [Bacillus sp. AFS055030]